MYKRIVNMVCVFVICTTFGVSLSSGQTEDIRAWSYEITSDTSLHHYKRTVEVRISERVSESELRDLGEEILNTASRRYDRTFITYYLTSMKVGSGAWATTHCDPDMKVAICGTTSDQKKTLIAESQKRNAGRDMIGTWRIEAPYVSRTIALFREDGKIERERIWKDGSSSIVEMSETKTKLGMRYQEKDADGSSDYYIINKKKDLELCDSYGLVDTGSQIEDKP